MSSNPPKNSDAQPGEYREDALHDTTARVKRQAAALLTKSRSDLNYQAPAIQYDQKTGLRYYEAAPVPLKRQFSSPLAQKGPNARGPNKERLVTSVWGDARSVGYDGNVDSNRRHAGLDFAAPVGEDILACADGRVTFVGYQGRPTGGRSVTKPRVKDSTVGTVYDVNDRVVAQATDLGHGGVFIQITHESDFAGYKTEYMHLSEALVETGARVTEGQVIGKVGRTGGNRGITSGPHLHWQVRFGGGHGTIVRPDILVPHYAPGRAVLAQATPIVPPSNITDTVRTVAEQVIHGKVLNALQTVQRAVAMENQGRGERDVLRQQQASAAEKAAKVMNMQASSLTEAIAKFQGALPIVSGGMTFDFDTGLWNDGKAV